MSVDPRDPMFHDEEKAREYFEAQRWPDGPMCPHCGSDHVHRLEGDAHRAGLLQCNDCLGQFSVTLNSVMESSHIPLTKWALGFHKMAASKKGISAKQLQRELGPWQLPHGLVHGHALARSHGHRPQGRQDRRLR